MSGYGVYDAATVDAQTDSMIREIEQQHERIEQLESLVRDMWLTWKRLDLEGDWPTSGHNGWKTFNQRMAALGLGVDDDQD